MFENLFGTEIPLITQFFLAFLIVLGLIWAAAWALYGISKERLGTTYAGGGRSRLSVVDSASLAERRRLVLVQRDGVEHLLIIGGPTDVIIEANIARTIAGPHEMSEMRLPAATAPPPSAIPSPDKGSRLLLPKPASIPRPAPRIESLPEEPVLPIRSQAESLTRPQRDMLAALANELSTGQPAPGKRPIAVMRSHKTGPRAELRPNPRIKPQPEPPIVMLPPVVAEAAAAETTSTPDENLEDMARHLEMALRKRNAASTANPSASPRLAVPPPEQAPSVQAAPAATPPAHSPSQSEPKRQRVNDKTPDDELALELTRLLGRTTNN
jgi:flagellar protein FliO/FliZ